MSDEVKPSGDIQESHRAATAEQEQAAPDAAEAAPDATPTGPPCRCGMPLVLLSERRRGTCVNCYVARIQDGEERRRSIRRGRR